MCVRLWVRRASSLMLSGHSLVLGALPSSTSSSSGGGTPVTVVTSSPSSPAPDAPGTLVPASTPRRLRLESAGVLKFLTLGLMGNTQASSDPLREGRWFCREIHLPLGGPSAQYPCRGKLDECSPPSMSSSFIQRSSSYIPPLRSKLVLSPVWQFMMNPP